MSKETRYFTPEEIERLGRMAGVGCNVEQMAAIIGVSKTTLERRMVDQPGVKEGILKGRAAAGDAVMETAYQMAVSGKSAVMTIFWLKCREHWKDRTDINITADDKADEKLDAVQKQLQGLLSGRTKKPE